VLVRLVCKLLDCNMKRNVKFVWYTDIMIHYTSNHPHNHKLAAFIFYINRMISIPITCKAIN